jgi:hypothetical protein
MEPRTNNPLRFAGLFGHMLLPVAPDTCQNTAHFDADRRVEAGRSKSFRLTFSDVLEIASKTRGMGWSERGRPEFGGIASSTQR